MYNAAVRLISLAINKKVKKPYAPLLSVKSAPIIVANKAPVPTPIAPFNPDALPAKSGFTFITPTLQLGTDIPFPKPINRVAPNIDSGEIIPDKTASSPTDNPKTETARPYITMFTGPTLFIKRLDTKLPKKKAPVIEPI